MKLSFLPWLAAAIYIPMAFTVWAVAWADAPWWGVMLAAIMVWALAPSLNAKDGDE